MPSDRRFKDLESEQLSEQWITAFQAWVNDLRSRSNRDEMEDLESELQLRGVEPPYDRAKNQMDALVSIASAAAEAQTPEQVWRTE